MINQLIFSSLAGKKSRSDIVIDNNSWSWWVKPISIYDTSQNVNYFATVDDNGDQALYRVDSQNNVTKLVVNTGFDKDEHLTPAFIIRSDHLFVCSASRNGNIFYTMKVSKDLQTITDKKNIYTDADMYLVAYSQVHEVDNKLVIFTRSASTDWRISISYDDGDTWSGFVWMMKDNGIIGGSAYSYTLSNQVNSTTVRAAMYHHPSSNSDNRLYIGNVDFNSGDYTSRGVSKGNIYSSYTAPYLHTFDPIYQPPTGYGFRLLDMTGNGNLWHILIGDLGNNNPALGAYKLVTYNATTDAASVITLPDHGDYWYTTYIAGAYFVQDELSNWNNEILLSREEDGIWYAEKYIYNGSTVAKVSTFDTYSPSENNDQISRPQPPVNSASGGLKVIYQKGVFNGSPVIFYNWDNQVIGKYKT